MAEGGNNPVTKPMDIDTTGRIPPSDKTAPRQHKPTISGEAKRRSREEAGGATRRTGRTDVVNTARSRARVEPTVAQKVSDWETKGTGPGAPTPTSTHTSTPLSTAQPRGLVNSRRSAWEKASEREPDTIPHGVPLPTTPHRENRENPVSVNSYQINSAPREARISQTVSVVQQEHHETHILRDDYVARDEKQRRVEGVTHVTSSPPLSGKFSFLVFLILLGIASAFILKARTTTYPFTHLISNATLPHKYHHTHNHTHTHTHPRGGDVSEEYTCPKCPTITNCDLIADALQELQERHAHTEAQLHAKDIAHNKLLGELYTLEEGVKRCMQDTAKNRLQSVEEERGNEDENENDEEGITLEQKAQNILQFNPPLDEDAEPTHHDRPTIDRPVGDIQLPPGVTPEDVTPVFEPPIDVRPTRTTKLVPPVTAEIVPTPHRPTIHAHTPQEPLRRQEAATPLKTRRDEPKRKVQRGGKQKKRP